MEERIFPKRAVIVTKSAAFHLTISSFNNRNTSVIENYTVSLGSRSKKCIQMNVPSIESGKKSGILMWVEKVGSVCSLNITDSKNLSHHALNLALTIARDINPECNRYDFDDCSSFKCQLPDHVETMSMKPFHIAFHGSTWYEKYFGAKLMKDHDLYERLKLNLYDPTKKPTHFNFKHSTLQDELDPLYSSTNTWYDFFQAIQKKYGDKKCGVVYPWIIDAMYIIFENNQIFEYQKWYIDVAKTPKIEFLSYEDAMKGGTRKKRNEIYNATPLNVRNPFRIQNMNYKAFLGVGS
jgi:hypothetical protein